jgi:hypothetical protein
VKVLKKSINLAIAMYLQNSIGIVVAIPFHPSTGNVPAIVFWNMANNHARHPNIGTSRVT